jgi:peroxiredoxin (alkyl hydroperoxide reductase subunit C)
LVSQYPYTDKELADNPALKDQFYQVGNRMWFKKANKQ